MTEQQFFDSRSERALRAAFFGSMSIVGVEIRRNDLSRVGEKSPARFLCTAEKNPVSEIAEVTHSEADPFQDFGLVVAAFNEAV